MTNTAQSASAKPVIKIASNKPGLRICFKSSRAISTIQKMPNGKYVVVKVYEQEVTEFDKYSEAKQEAISAAMMPATPEKTEEVPDLHICHKAGRAVSTIQKMPDGRWQVVKLYEERASDFEELSAAEHVATNAAMKQPPRTTKDAA